MANMLKTAKAQHIKELAQQYLSNAGVFPVLSDEYLFLPAFLDVHVHFREPGFFYKESIETGSASAARGGYGAVCTMPNLSPVPDARETLSPQLEAIARDACVRVIPYGAITKGEAGAELSDMEDIAGDVCAFSDDGRGVQDEDMMRAAMLKAKALGKMIVAHCEVNELLHGGYIHDGEYARTHGHRGICSESEWRMIERDIRLAKETGCPYHVCHISTKESVALIREAKAQGVDITCETAPHYLVFTDADLCEDGKWKMNPPLRAYEDRDALIEGILDGTIDMIATDHAPHSAEEKSRGLEKSAFGIVGLESAFAVMYTHFVRTGILSLDRLVELMSTNPRERFGIDTGDDFCIFDVSSPYKIDPNEFATKGRATPFEGHEVYGRCLCTVSNGRIAYLSPELKK